MKSTRSKWYRRGVSLVELLVVMSAATVILTLSTGLIHRIMHAQSKARVLADGERTTLRLGDRFRRDVHQATHVTVDKSQLADGSFLRLHLADGSTLEYRREATTIRRVQRDGSSTIAQDEFSFGEGFEVEVNGENGRVVVLSITSRRLRTNDAVDQPERITNAIPVDLQVVAAIGQRGAK